MNAPKTTGFAHPEHLWAGCPLARSGEKDGRDISALARWSETGVSSSQSNRLGDDSIGRRMIRLLNPLE